MALTIFRPDLKRKSIENLRDFFSEKNLSEKEILKNAKALLWYLNEGRVRVYDVNEKRLNTWVKRGILAYFSHSTAQSLNAGTFEYFDKLPIKKRVSLKGVRVVPGAIARFGSFIEPGSILMPSFVNVGAFVGKNSMIDTWATVGSCAQIGEGVHLSGGVGIGGVLEPLQANPVIIEDGVFIGSRSVIVEGVHVHREAVLGAGVVLTASTKIVDLRIDKKDSPIFSGYIPERAVVIPGVLPYREQYGVPCALLIGERSASTDKKTSLNSALRDFGVAV